MQLSFTNVHSLLMSPFCIPTEQKLLMVFIYDEAHVTTPMAPLAAENVPTHMPIIQRTWTIPHHTLALCIHCQLDSAETLLLLKVATCILMELQLRMPIHVTPGVMLQLYP